MKQATHLHSESLEPTKGFDIGNVSPVTVTATAKSNSVVVPLPYCRPPSADQVATTAKFNSVVVPFPYCRPPSADQVATTKPQSIADFMAELEADADFRHDIQQARAWVADEFYAEDGDTVRTLRLRNGWSQAQLAEKLATSQPHIAKIERGKENLHISTCRKLCLAFGIDMNTLDAMLQRQEAIFAGKQK